MGVEQFQQFIKKSIDEGVKNTDVWLYTRVSSKDQEANKSLETQKEAGIKYAKDNGYQINRIFGQTYESASGDFTRKEFSRLIREIKQSRKRPFAILIFTISRFSRTGGNGITLAHELIEALNVNLIEVSSGKSTVTEEGKIEIYNGLIRARQENLDRLKVTLPGLKKVLLEGGWIGNVPRGYTKYGKRVKSRMLYSESQEIKINDDGEIIRRAWQWKLQGEKDCEILVKLKNLGVSMKKQALSEMWRNPFYCGISVNKMLEEPVKGKWAKIVSEEDFLYVQELLKVNKFGYKQENEHVKRPLTAFIQCHKCGGKMAGYEVKYKKKHYYKCQKCLGVSINVETSPKSKGAGANELFKRFINGFQLPEHLGDAFIKQLRLTYATLNAEADEDASLLKKELESTETKLKTIKRNHALGDIDRETFIDVKNEFEEKIDNLKTQIEIASNRISNLDIYIEQAMQIAQNIGKYWNSIDPETTKKAQELVFPHGVVIDTENRQYLTKKVNLVFVESAVLAGVLEDIKKDDTEKKSVSSCVVPESRLELPTFGL